MTFATLQTKEDGRWAASEVPYQQGCIDVKAVGQLDLSHLLDLPVSLPPIQGRPESSFLACNRSPVRLLVRLSGRVKRYGKPAVVRLLVREIWTQKWSQQMLKGNTFRVAAQVAYTNEDLESLPQEKAAYLILVALELRYGLEVNLPCSPGFINAMA